MFLFLKRRIRDIFDLYRILKSLKEPYRTRGIINPELGAVKGNLQIRFALFNKFILLILRLKSLDNQIKISNAYCLCTLFLY